MYMVEHQPWHSFILPFPANQLFKVHVMHKPVELGESQIHRVSGSSLYYYVSDMTRIYLSKRQRNLGDEQAEIYNTVLKANQALD